MFLIWKATTLAPEFFAMLPWMPSVNFCCSFDVTHVRHVDVSCQAPKSQQFTTVTQGLMLTYEALGHSHVDITFYATWNLLICLVITIRYSLVLFLLCERHNVEHGTEACSFWVSLPLYSCVNCRFWIFSISKIIFQANVRKSGVEMCCRAFFLST